MKINLVKLLRDNVSLIVTALIVAMMSSYLGRWSQKDDIDLWKGLYNAYRDTTAVLVEENRQLTVRVENIQRYVAEINDSIVALNRNLDVRVAQLDDLRGDLDSIKVNITPEILVVTPPEVKEYVASLETT